MKPLAPLLVAVAVAPPVAFATRALTQDARTEGAVEAASGDSDVDVDLAARFAALDARLAQLSDAVEARIAPERRAAAGTLAPAIAEALATHGVQLDPNRLETGSEDRAAARAALLARVDAVLEGADELTLTQTFAALADEGSLDAVLDELRARSDADPKDVEAAEELARAAVAAMNTVAYGPRAMTMADLAGDAYRRALTADPERDDLRFDRAEVLARTPRFLGRRPEAIQELETVIERGDRGGTVTPETYRLLGTLLLEQGARDRAVEAWQAGGGAFPDDETLQDLLRLHAND